MAGARVTELRRTSGAADEQEQAERIIKAFRAAELLASDLKEAHAQTENGREKVLLIELLSDAQRIRDRLNRLARAKGVALNYAETKRSSWYSTAWTEVMFR